MKTSIQLSFFDNNRNPLTEHPEISERVRREIHEGIEYLSLVDIMGEFSDLESRPTVLWNRTKKRLTEENFSTISSVIRLKMTAKDGKERLTDCADIETCLRIIQSIPSDKAEPVKEWLAWLGAREIDEAQHPERAVARRLHELSKLEKAGYGNTPEVQRLRARHEGIDAVKELKDIIYRICEKPNYAQFFNAEYMALFGELASGLKHILGTDSIRDALPERQLAYLRVAELNMQELMRQSSNLTMEQILMVVDKIVKPLGENLREVSDMLGVSHITGQALIGSGQ